MRSNPFLPMARAATLAVFCFLAVPTLLAPTTAAAGEEPLFARAETDSGSILVVLYPELAPGHVANFVHLAKSGFYEGTKFHRCIPDFMIQGGDPNSKDLDPRNDGMGGPILSDVLDDEGMKALNLLNEKLEKQGYKGLGAVPANLKAEFSRTATHLRGTLSMARGGHDVDSAGSQFFICVVDKTHLDGQYSIFGTTVLGMDVADRIVHGEKRQGAGQGAPVNPVKILRVEILEGTGGLTADESAAWEALPADRKSVK